MTSSCMLTVLFVVAITFHTEAATSPATIESSDDGSILIATNGPVKLVQTDGDGVDMSTLTTLVSQTILDEAIAKLPTQEAITTLTNQFATLVTDMTGTGGYKETNDAAVEDLKLRVSNVESFAEGLRDQAKLLSSTYIKPKDADAKYSTISAVNDKFLYVQTTLKKIEDMIIEINGTKGQGGPSPFALCSTPTDPANGKWSYKLSNPGDHPKLPFVPGVSVYFQCDDGFGVEGAVAGKDNRAYERICGTDGKWYSPDKQQTGLAKCESCGAAGQYTSIDPVTWYSQTTGGARWGGADFRSGGPGCSESQCKWVLGPMDKSGVTGLKFEYEYVTGYSWNCGYSKVTGFRDCRKTSNVDPQLKSRFANGPELLVSIQDADDATVSQLVYQSRKLEDYPYDNCGANGGWGDKMKKEDGCYSPAVVVKSEFGNNVWSMTESEDPPTCNDNANPPVPCNGGPTTKQQAKDRAAKYALTAQKLGAAKKVKVVFGFRNNGRNMHLNPNHMSLAIKSAPYDATSRACKK